MKIGIVLAKPPGYSETFLNSKIKGLLQHGHEVSLFVRENPTGFNQCPVLRAPKVHQSPMIQVLKMVWVFSGLCLRYKRLYRFIMAERASGTNFKTLLKRCFTNAHLLKADMDWLHFGFSTLARGSEHVAKSIGAKMAVSCRGYDMDVYPLKHPNCYAPLWPHVDKVHAISEYMLQKAYDHGLPKATTTAVIYPAIDTTLFQTKTKAQNKAKIVMTTIARLHWIKGLNDTLEALAHLKAKDIDFSYSIIGEGPEYEPLRYAVHNLDLDDTVQFLGKRSHQEIVNHLKQTDVYIQYSQSEGFCNAVLEAQAMGCLCVVSDGGALPENVLHNETGWVVPKSRPRLLAEQIEAILALPSAEQLSIKNKAKERVLNEFNLETQQKQFIKFYE